MQKRKKERKELRTIIIGSLEDCRCCRHLVSHSIQIDQVIYGGECEEQEEDGE